MKKLICFITLVGLCGLLQGSPILAISLDFVPASQTVFPPGQSVAVDIVISGLGDGISPSVGAFDLEVSFDPTALSPLNVTFGPFLGDPDTGEAFHTFFFVPGAVDFAAISFLLPTDLDALQSASFTLATLSFNTLTLGTSSLIFTQTLIIDAFGQPLILNSVGEGTVTKVVPEPSTLILVGTGALGLLGYGWRQKKRRA